MATKAEKEAFEARQAKMREIKGVTKEQRQKQKDKTILQSRILADLGLLALSALPVGAVIRGGQLIYRGLKGAKAMAAVRKVLAASKKAAKSRKDYRPSTQALADAGKRLKKVAEVRKKVKESKEKPATTTKKPQDKPKEQPKTQTTTAKKPQEQPKRLTQQPKKIPKKKPGTAVTVTKPKPKPKTTSQPKSMKKADVVSSTTRTPKKVTGPAKPKKTLTKKQKAAIAAAVIAGGAAGVKIATTKKPAEADPTPKKRTPKGGYVRPKPPGSGKKITSVIVTDEKGPDKSIPKAGKRASNRTSISAGPNTGFGLKGNIFPSNAKERRELMAKFGGTGSRAARAAMAGTQGNIKKKKS